MLGARRRGVLLEDPADTPFNFPPWAESLPIQVDSSTLSLDSHTAQLNEFFSWGSFDLERMCSYEPLLALWGIHPDPLLARGLDLGEFPLSLYLCFWSYFFFLIWWTDLFLITNMVMTNFFKFDEGDAAKRRTLLRTTATAVNPAPVIANRKLAEARIAQASQPRLGSPRRILSARPFRAVIDLEGSSQRGSPSDHIPPSGQSTPRVVDQSDVVQVVPDSCVSTSPRALTESTHDHVAHTPVPAPSAESRKFLLFV